MILDYSDKVKTLIARLEAFMDEHVYPNEAEYFRQIDSADDRWNVPPILDELKSRARDAGLWNLFLPESDRGAGLTNTEYAPLAEITGRSLYAPEIFNCSAPDTGNMEVLERYGTDEQKQRFLEPLLAGEIRSAFLMTEPDVASSDATNIRCEIRRDGDEYVINGEKWWNGGAPDRRTKVFIVMGKTDPDSDDRYRQQSMILVERDRPGVSIKRNLPVYGYDYAPHGHGHVVLNNVRVPRENLILGEGRGFEIAQGRLGPGRIHHCMRTIGAAERALEQMIRRLDARVAFGRRIIESDVWQERIAEARMNIEMARLLTLKAAYMMDTVGNKVGRAEISMIKVVAPTIALKIIDDAVQAHGAIGVSDDPGLAKLWTWIRILRIADGPDEVHRRTVARLELKKYGIRG